MPHPELHRLSITLRAMVLCAIPCLLLAGCGGGGGSSETGGNAVEMRDMDIVDGTVNDSMTDLDAVRADGVGALGDTGNTGNVSRPAPARQTPEEDSPGAETVPAE